MISAIVLSGLLMLAPSPEPPTRHMWISEENCSGPHCRESVDFAVDFEVCEVLVEGFDISKANKGTARIESIEIDGVDVPEHELVGTEKEIPFFFVSLDSASVGALVPSTSAKDESLLEHFIEVKVKDGKVYAVNWHLSDEVMYFLTEDCKRLKAWQ